MLPKRIALFGTARSGSNWVFQTLAHYLRKRDPGSAALNEYFNTYMLNDPFLLSPSGKGLIRSHGIPKGTPGAMVTTFGMDQGSIRQVDLPHNGENIPHEDLCREAEKRLDWLVESEQRQLVKIFPFHLELCPRILEHVQTRCEVICIERNDTVSQALSACLSHASGVWTVGGDALPPRFEPGQFRAEPGFVSGFFRSLKSYREIKARVKPRVTLEYEKILAFPDIREVLTQVGFEDWRALNPLAPDRIRQNPNEDYLQYFNNGNELMGWIKEHH